MFYGFHWQTFWQELHKVLQGNKTFLSVVYEHDFSIFVMYELGICMDGAMRAV
jgi:hypothetical protein